MYRYIEKIKLCFLLLIALVGFFTGINYYKIVRIDDISSIKDCFEFGLYPLLDGNSNSKIFMAVVLSSVKHYALFTLGMFNWAVFFVGLFNLFGLSFKLGVSFKCTFSLVGIKGFISIFLLALLVILIVFISVLFLYFVLNKKIYRVKGYRINFDDIGFIKKSFVALFVFIVIVFVFLIMLKYTNSRLYGLLKTIL